MTKETWEMYGDIHKRRYDEYKQALDIFDNNKNEFNEAEVVYEIASFLLGKMREEKDKVNFAWEQADKEEEESK